MNVTSRITLVAAMLIAAAPAAATNGMRMIGFGPVQNSMGGVGVGASLDSATIVTNPAGMADMGKRVDAAATYFAPSVDYKAVWTPDETNFFPAAEESNRDPSFIPTLGLVYTLNDKVAAGIAVVGTAGMGVDYDADLFGSSLMTSYMNLRVAPAVSYKLNDQFAVGDIREQRLGAGHGIRGLFDRLVDHIQNVRPDQAVGDLAQGQHGGFVVLPAQGGRGAVGQLPGALGGHQHQLETVGDVVQTVFYGDACHGPDLVAG